MTDSDTVDAYLEATAHLERLSARCDGLIADVRQRYEALCRWQDGVAERAPLEAVEAALTDFALGEPPSWTALRAALNEWVTVTRRVCELWAALSAEERPGLTPPAIVQPEGDSIG